MSRKKKHKEHAEFHIDERWLLPYADMITLLLGLFIVLFAMSSIDAKQFDNLRRSLAETFEGSVLNEPGNVLDGASGVLDPEAANQRPDSAVARGLTEASDAQAKQVQKQAQRISNAAQESGLTKDKVLEVDQSERGIVISITGDALFASGSAEISAQMRVRLLRVLGVIRNTHQPLAIEGHTDGQPLNGGGRYLDNLDLSMARAAAVLRFLEDGGIDAQRMRATGYGDTRPKVTPESPTAAEPANRRIEIVLMAPGTLDADPTGSKEGGRAVNPNTGLEGAKPAPQVTDPIGPVIDL